MLFERGRRTVQEHPTIVVEIKEGLHQLRLRFIRISRIEFETTLLTEPLHTTSKAVPALYQAETRILAVGTLSHFVPYFRRKTPPRSNPRGKGLECPPEVTTRKSPPAIGS